METPLEQKLNDFQRTTGRSKVAVIVPLYGYWNTIPEASRQVDGDALKTVVDRIKSIRHDLYFFFVAEPAKIPDDVAKYLVSRQTYGNTKGVSVDNNASYGEYVREGLDAALEETKAQFLVVINPWTIVQPQAIDDLVERLNKVDDAKLVCGYDIRTKVTPEDFDTWHTQTPFEERCVTFNLAGMERRTAEMVMLDSQFKSHLFVERDTWQTMFKNGYESISTQRVPIYTFDMDWTMLETPSDIEADKAYFANKWGFTPQL